MVQLMGSDYDNHFIKKVKLEESQQQDDDVRAIPNKRPRFDFNLDSSPKCDLSDDSVQISPGLYNPLNEPSPLGLRLKKSPSLLDLIQMRFSEQHDSNKKNQKAVAAADSKLKASNFPTTILKIGTWDVKY
ncbi:unnamed protein product [Lathyrus sativus]|nr:unnamed protein product [Lathyrus sativus]